MSGANVAALKASGKAFPFRSRTGDLGLCALDANGADREARFVLLLNNDMLDAGTAPGFGGVGLPVRPGIGLPLGFLRWMQRSQPCHLGYFSLAWLWRTSAFSAARPKTLDYTRELHRDQSEPLSHK